MMERIRWLDRLLCATLVVVLLAGVLIGCQRANDVGRRVAPMNAAQLDVEYHEFDGLNGVFRIRDPQTGVLCYAYAGHEKGGISCVYVGR